MWVTEGTKTDPAQGDILADTGALGVGIYGLTALIWSNAGINVQLEIAQRDNLNASDVVAQRFSAPSTPITFPVTISTMGQRIVVRVVDGFTGDVQVSLVK